MNKSSMYAALALVALGAFAIHNHFGNLWPVISTAYANVTYQTDGEDVRTDKWELTSIQKFPAVVTEDKHASVGIVAGALHATKKAEWWLFYAEAVETPFLLVAAHVDGKAIVLCEEDGGAFCEYRPSPGGGASVLELTTAQVKAIQAGKEIELTFFFNDEFVYTRRSLGGISEQIDKLLATTIVPEVKADEEEVTVPDWTLYETKDKMLGHVVLIHGPIETGEVVLSWSSVAHDKGLVDIKDYSGSEMFFKPREGDVVTLEDAYWMHNGQRVNIEIVDACKKDDGKLCVFRGGVSIVMSTTDLVWMQIGHKFILEWRDANGKLNISSAVLGPKSYSFNTRIQELIAPEDTGGLQPHTHTST